jgi:2-desacetyl-2-hydroxyethyl bacteriochlorophyllide A dehydrogenase
MRAAQWEAPKALRLVELDEPEAEAGQVLVQVLNCGICGSDLHSYLHGVAAVPGQVLGHEFSGRVLEAPEVDGIDVGDLVTVRPLLPCGDCPACVAGEPQRCEQSLDIGYGVNGAFADRVLVPRAVAGKTVFKLPDGLDHRAAALTEPLSVGLHAINRAEVDTDDVVLVMGVGMIGLGIVALLHSLGCERIVVADLSPLRRERALALGAAAAVDPGEQDVARVVRRFAGEHERRGADVVFDCAGAAPALEAGLKALRRGGTGVLVAAYGREIPVFLDRVMGKEISLIGSIAYRDEFPDVLRLLAEGRIDPEPFISHTFALDDIEQAFRTQADAQQAVKVLVQPHHPDQSQGTT